MRWENQNGSFSVPSAPVWGTQKEFGYGEGPILDRSPDCSSDELLHYGIPGMKWGVRAKEYVKTGYNTMARRMAIQKMQRKAAAKATAQRQFNEGYQHGQRAASNTHFIRSRSERMLSKKHEGEKESLLDRGIGKGVGIAFKKLDLEKTAREMGFSKQAISTAKTAATNLMKNLKDQKLDELYDWIQTDNGKEKLQKAVTFISKGTARAVYASSKAAPKIGRASRQAARMVGSGAKKLITASAKKSLQAIREGRHRRAAQRTKDKANRIRQTVSKRLNQGANALDKGAQYAHKGAHAAQRGLDQLLKKRPRRHG